MATNKPVGDDAWKGAVRKRTQLKGKLMGKSAWTQRNKESGQFMDVKTSNKKFKGVRAVKLRATDSVVWESGCVCAKPAGQAASGG